MIAALEVPAAKHDHETPLNTTSASAPAIKMNRHELQFADHYIRTNMECLVKVKERSKNCFNIMDSVFSLYGLPVELKYLAVIESDLKTSALSRVGARGPWQLMPGTARILGLKVSRHYDERTSYHKSTRAAAMYLKDLYSEFGDWLLVLAAYNSGPVPVYRAIHRSGSRNFWALQRFLPAETRGHVKRFIATHYYFENQGSATTLTKAENLEYAKSVRAFLLAQTASGTTEGIEVNRWKKIPAPIGIGYFFLPVTKLSIPG